MAGLWAVRLRRPSVRLLRNNLRCLEGSNSSSSSRQALLHIGPLYNNWIPPFRSECSLSVGRLREAGTCDTVGHAIHPAVQEGILLEMSLVCSAIRRTLRHRKIA